MREGTSRLSTHRFEQLPDMRDGMANPNDVTIDIPLTATPSRGQNGIRKWGSNVGSAVPVESQDEKAALGPGLRRRRDDNINEHTGKPSESPEDGKVNRLGRIYQAIYNFSVVTRYMIYVIPVGIIFAIPIVIGATASQNARIGGVHIYWFFAWIEVVWVSLWTCKIFAKFIPFVFQTLCGIVSSGTRKYALILRSLETPITLVLWCVVSLVTFLPIMTLNPSKKSNGDTDVTTWEKSVKNILFALLVCSLIYLCEKATIQLISISYHRKQFDAKIKESKHNVYLVGLLFEASRNMFPMHCPEFADEDAEIEDSILVQEIKKSKRSSMMPLRMVRKVGANVGRIGDKVSNVFGKTVFNQNANHTMVIEALERKRCAAAMARRIWMSFVVEGRESLFMDDIVEVLGPDHEEDAEECFNRLDKDGNGDISLDEMILTVTEFGRMRQSLNHSMHDVDQAINVLDNLLLCVAGIVGILVFISFVTTGFGTVIAAGATSLLSLSFVFSTTAQEVLGSCIFLFVKHPFDIGDRVDIGDKSYVVDRISLLFSVFRTVSDQRMSQVPNNILNSLWIDNFTRANAMHEQLTVPVAFDTSFTEIQRLRDEMEAFVRHKDNSRDFQPDIYIEVGGVGDMDKLELIVLIRHKSNWSNETVRAARRSKFMCALVLAIRKVPIRAPGVAAEEPKPEGDETDDQDGKDDKPDAGKMAGGLTAAAAVVGMDYLPPNTAQTSGSDLNRSNGTLNKRGPRSTPSSEAAAIEQINARSPATDVYRDEREMDLTRSTTTKSTGHRLSVQGTDISRSLSTGQRKAGRVSYAEQDFAPLSPVRAGLTPSSRAVFATNPSPNSSPGLGPGSSLSIVSSQGSTIYNSSHHQSHDNYESIPLGGYNSNNQSQPLSGLTPSSHYDPISPPSPYSPGQGNPDVPTSNAERQASINARKNNKNQHGGHQA
ncbi:hypothetical protein N7495_000133 [Penicillium taxi]|uniref:uncharacterized protein n=1 Tax=Penicillium taxi TaxID=168475 RepID=UPI00254500AA|nr:uncharacterized protein N7495_000133 [Penicillium taxi]KAJ5907451.1 hypothetical protein N7495_000133 [Penicillium taxi]